MEVSKFTAELMDYLSPREWKSALELMNEMGNVWKMQGRRRVFCYVLALVSEELAEVFQKPSSGSIYVSLEELTSQSLAEWRWRDDPPEILAKRGGRRRMEWRLTEQGHRVRAVLPSLEKTIDGILIPGTTT